MSDLSNTTDADMRAELKRRDDAARAKEKADRLATNRIIFAARDTILPLLRHDRSSCSDENPNNGSLSLGIPRCEKCALMTLEDWNLEDVSIDLQIQVRSA